MTAEEHSIRNIYIITAGIGLAGALTILATHGGRAALAFLLGALASCGNLWLFDWVSNAVGPDYAGSKSWQALAYMLRYVILIGVGYAIVKSLQVNALAVILGLLASSAAVLLSLILELLLHLRRGKTSR